MKRIIVLEFVAMIFVAILVFIIGATIIAKNSLNNTTELNLNQYIDMIETDAEELDYPSLIDKYDDVSNHIRITIIDPDGVVLVDSEADELDNHLNRPEVQNLGESYIRHSDTLDIEMMYLASRLSTGDYLRVAIPTASTIQFLNDFIGLSIVIGVVIIVLSVLITTLLINQSLKPMKDIKNHLRLVQEGTYNDIMPVEKYDEVNGLIKEINHINHLISKQIASLRFEKNKTDFLINQMNQGICVLNADKQILFLNQFLKDIYRFNIDTNINKDYRFLFREDQIQKAIDVTYESQTDKHIVTEKDQRYYSISIYYSKENWNNQPSVIIIYSDITSIKHIENLKKDFFENASHELKSPLTSIIGSSELIKEDMVKDKAAMMDLIDRIHHEAKRMNHLVMDMLKLSELESHTGSTELTDVSVQPVIDDVINHLSVLIKDQQVSINKEIDLKYIRLNRDDLYHLIKNMLENAIKYSREAGQIWIKVYESNHHQVLEIKDEGIGIPEDEQDRIFERFYRVDKARSRISGGTGLGLSIVKHIVLNAGGKIDLRSEEQKGTTIQISLPKKVNAK